MNKKLGFALVSVGSLASIACIYLYGKYTGIEEVLVQGKWRYDRKARRIVPVPKAQRRPLRTNRTQDEVPLNAH